MQKVVVGIDFGTTNSIMAYIKNERLEVLHVGNNGKTLMKSIVSYYKEPPMVDPPTSATQYSEYSVKNVKRCLGIDYSEDIAAKGQPMFNTTIEKNTGNGKCLFRIQKPKKNGKVPEIIINPEEVASLVIKKLLEKLKEREIISSIDDIEQVCMGIPATFNEDQRLATKKAAELAGLKNVQFIHEPTAAVLDYCHDFHYVNNEYIIVYDFGGGTFDATLVHVHDNNEYDVICTSGNESLGGSDIDNALMQYVMDLYSSSYKELIDLNEISSLNRKQKSAITKFRQQCEEAKVSLSCNQNVGIPLDYLKDLEINGGDEEEEDEEDEDEKDDEINISREEFEKLIDPYIKRTFQCINSLLEEGEKRTNLNRKLFKKMVLIGGSSRIANLPDLIRSEYNWIEVIQDCNPDECVAKGACLYAQSIHSYSINNGGERIEGGIRVRDRVPFIYGIAVEGDRVHHLIKKGETIPTEKYNYFTTTEDNQTDIVSAVYTGDSEWIKDCKLIHKFKFGPITRKPKGKANILITYKLDSAGILQVVCEEVDEQGNHRQVGVKDIGAVCD